VYSIAIDNKYMVIIMAERSIETNEERFKRIATKRVQAILDKLRLLGNCANTSFYGYTEDDKRRIFSSIDAEVKRVKTLFDETGHKGQKFSLE
jgi:hypothetical protein